MGAGPSGSFFDSSDFGIFGLTGAVWIVSAGLPMIVSPQPPQLPQLLHPPHLRLEKRDDTRLNSPHGLLPPQVPEAYPDSQPQDDLQEPQVTVGHSEHLTGQLAGQGETHSLTWCLQVGRSAQGAGCEHSV